jgi:peptide/nickel transport system permease protein
MKRLTQRMAWALGRLLLFSMLAGLVTASLVRFGPGFGVDERELDSRLSRQSVEAIRSKHQLKSGLLSYYGRYLAGAVRGDLGTSEWLQRPVSSLIRERFPVTARSVLLGVLVAWITTLAAALSLIRFRGMALELSGTMISGFLIALPSAVVAVFSVYLRAPVCLAIAVVIFPKLFRYVQNLLQRAQAQPYVLAAQARGIGRWRVIFRHVFPLASPALVALLGVSLSLAFGAAVPIEALCDSPGIGQLAWQATLNRDLPLIMNLALLATVITVAANSLASVMNERAS